MCIVTINLYSINENFIGLEKKVYLKIKKISDALPNSDARGDEKQGIYFVLPIRAYKILYFNMSEKDKLTFVIVVVVYYCLIFYFYFKHLDRNK